MRVWVGGKIVFRHRFLAKQSLMDDVLGIIYPTTVSKDFSERRLCFQYTPIATTSPDMLYHTPISLAILFYATACLNSAMQSYGTLHGDPLPLIMHLVHNPIPAQKCGLLR